MPWISYGLVLRIAAPGHVSPQTSSRRATGVIRYTRSNQPPVPITVIEYRQRNSYSDGASMSPRFEPEREVTSCCSAWTLSCAQYSGREASLPGGPSYERWGGFVCRTHPIRLSTLVIALSERSYTLLFTVSRTGLPVGDRLEPIHGLADVGEVNVLARCTSVIAEHRTPIP